jgi:hypothetical protein
VGNQEVVQVTVDASVSGTRKAEAEIQGTIRAAVQATRQGQAALAAPAGTSGVDPDQPVSSLAPSQIGAVWANDGGDKVTRDELRATVGPDGVLNSVWDGTEISLFGARSEVVSFNLVLEAPEIQVPDVNVILTGLVGPGGALITSTPTKGAGVFTYLGRDIELFYVRYLEIKGLSTDLFFTGYAYDERHIPARCRRPYDPETGEGHGTWEDRPCHNKRYPEIAVPLELSAPFAIPAGTNQSIWGDIHIPADAPAGDYGGMVVITEVGVPTWQIPIRLRVRAFSLPDLPTARTMLYVCLECINDRYLGRDAAYPEVGSDLYLRSLDLLDRHFHLAHRHKISLIDHGDTTIEEMKRAWTARLDGSLFTAARGYEGIGSGMGNNVYAIGTYGSWSWREGSQEEMWAQTDAWIRWFDAKALATPTDVFLYLIDESEDYSTIEQWAGWVEGNPGPGRRLLTLATLDLPAAAEHTPSLDLPTSWFSVGRSEPWQAAADRYRADPRKRLYLYNSNRPASGSFAIEDEGVALRELAWGQYKMGVDRWFYWESTYYDNYQGNTGQTNVFETAHTFGDLEGVDPELGETGWNYLNGDGVLFYPGTDRRYPEASYSVPGPFASLRLKHWRRGIQDADYLALAAAVDPQKTAGIVQRMVPKVLWELGVADPEDPTWVLSDIAWPTDPDLWEAARAELADIIEGTAP